MVGMGGGGSDVGQEGEAVGAGGALKGWAVRGSFGGAGGALKGRGLWGRRSDVGQEESPHTPTPQTTIMAVEFDGGVVIGADSRTTTG